MNKAGEVKFEGSLSSPKDSREEVHKGHQKKLILAEHRISPIGICHSSRE